MVPQLLEYHITQTVSAQAKAEEYSAAAAACGGTLKVHIKVDTGMSRLGFLVRGEHFAGGVEAIARSCDLPGLEAEGIFTHFAVSDEDDAASEAYTKEQFATFTRVLDALAQRGRTFAIRHCANSGALVLILLLVILGGGGAFAYIKFIKPKQGAKVSADPDDYEFEDEECLLDEE